MSQHPYPYLDRVNWPADFRSFTPHELKGLCSDVREYLIEVVSNTGGHLGAGLGAVELAVALHYVFNTPDDKLVWDVGHQAYPAQDPHRTEGPAPHDPAVRRPQRFPEADGERIRHLRRGTREHGDVGGARDGGGAGPDGRATTRWSRSSATAP